MIAAAALVAYELQATKSMSSVKFLCCQSLHAICHTHPPSKDILFLKSGKNFSDSVYQKQLQFM